MTRSRWKGPYINIENLEHVDDLKKHSYKQPIASRNCEIVPKFIGFSFKVHNGKNFNEVNVTEEMIGHKFGEFSFTRSKFSFKKQKSKK